MMDAVKEFFNERADKWNDYQTETINDLKGLLALIPLKKGMRVLDLACGTGIISELLQSITESKVTAIDISDNMIKNAMKNHNSVDIDFKVANFYEYEDEPFDAIVCFNAYPHFLDVDGFVNKAHSLLKKEGYLVILHSIGRVCLDNHHAAFAANVSRHLKSPKDEYVSYKDKFIMEKEIDTDSKYLMILKKTEK